MVRYESLDDVPDRYRDAVAAELGDEAFLCGTRAVYGDLMRLWPRLILAETRLIWIRKSWINSRVENYPLDTIAALDTAEGGNFKLKLTTTGGTSERYKIDLTDGPEFARRLRQQMSADGQ